MCDILSMTAVAIGAASTGANVASQAQAAGEQNRYRRSLGISQNKQYQENAEAVIRDVGLQIDQIAQRDIERIAAARQEIEGISRNVREAGATARAATAAAGIEGRSVDLLHSQFSRDIAEFESSMSRNVRTMRAQSAIEAEAIYARGQNAINQGYPNPLPPVATVNPLTSIMNGITTGLSAYSALSSFRTPPGVGAAANVTTNNAAAPWYLQANPSPGTFGTPSLLAAPTPEASAPFFLSR